MHKKEVSELLSIGQGIKRKKKKIKEKRNNLAEDRISSNFQ